MPTNIENEETAPTITPEQSPLRRTIGVEIECFVANDKYSQAVRSVGTAGAQCVGDGSIDPDEGTGVEVRTPPKTGNDAETLITNVCTALNAANAGVNSSTGLHVHVDAKEIDPKKVVRPYGTDAPPLKSNEQVLYVPTLMLTTNDLANNHSEIIALVEQSNYVPAYGRYGAGHMIDHHGRSTYERNTINQYLIPQSKQREYVAYAVDFTAATRLRSKMFAAMRFLSACDAILRSLVPTTRRHNRYCQAFEKTARIGGQCPATLREIQQGIVDRYAGINLIALQRHGTIECRYHQGSLNAQKIIHWARLFEGIVNAALQQDAGTEADALADIPNTSDRLQMLCAHLNLPASTTAYLAERHTAFMASDARRRARYITTKQRYHAQHPVCAA